MGFFDKKEEVLDVELTSYGNYLLSQGRLDPVYYAFFDDDVLYDLKSAGTEEFQNQTDRRIKYDTPSLKAQAHINGAETRVNAFEANVTSGPAAGWSTVTDNSVEFVDAFNRAPDPFGAQSQGIVQAPLGSSDMKSEYAPGWQIRLLNGEISSSQDYYTANLIKGDPGLGDGYVQNIPQLNIELDYKTFFSTEEERSFSDVNYTQLSPPINEAGICLYVEENYLLLDIQEINGIFGKETFDVEVFISGSPHVVAPPDHLTQLTFISETELLNNAASGKVPFHLNLLTDKGIPDAIQEAHNIRDYIGRGSSARLRLGRDLYGDTPNEEPCD